ncbi:MULTISPECIES: hypothetical protein [unclassified Novosphingobium]|uniref:hypothetical protein n=1 Tax=unclassified Novosphingobium TaxID=2644732 RepID=UPI0025DC6F33|nr:MULTISPECIES: hypothetical protein [unclassified Novosphingobium]HQV02723.1 hypothetical protein [Novosphingobium sp.]
MAQATGVSAGTLIENTASATYTSGTASGTVQSNTVTVRVDELLDVAVAGLTSTPVSAGSGTAVLAYSVTNTGNGPEAFNLAINPAVAGNQFDATVQQVVIDSNGNGTYDPGVDAVLPSGSPTPSIAADGSLTVFVIVSLPTTATDGQTSQVELTASAVTGTGTPGTAFAGQGAGGGDAVVGSSGADDNAFDSLIATLATVSLTKAASIADPFGGSQPVPGAVVTYTLTATVNGTGQVENLHVTDAYPTGTTYEASTMTLDAAALTDAADADAGTASGTGIDVNLGTVAGGTTKVVKFNVKIN